MKLPRWTVYPALGVLATLVVTAVPRASETPEHSGKAKRARELYRALDQGGEEHPAQILEVPQQPEDDRAGVPPRRAQELSKDR